MTTDKNDGLTNEERSELFADASRLSLGEVRGGGAKGNGPEGAPDGEIDFAVGYSPENGRIVVNFGGPISALCMSVEDCKRLEKALREARLTALSTKKGR
jgi:hypothetical protein